MAEDAEDRNTPAFSPDPAALNVALAGASATEEAREYLRKQSRLADLQIENLEKLDEFELSHLRFRRVSDYARVALEIAAGLVILLVICGLGTMVWSASQDDDLVVEAFSVPPDVAQTGLTGSVLAGRILDRFGDMDRNVRGFTADFSGYHGTSNEDVRVEIPDTGISIGELNRYLRGWLGHETHVTGELVKSGGSYSLTVRYGDDPGTTVEGSASDLDKLIQKAAENMFLAAKPLRFADYLSSHGRFAEARAIVEREIRVGSDVHKAAAYVSLGNIDYWSGDERDLARQGPRAVALDPKNIVAWFMLVSGANNFDHDEDEWRLTNSAIAALKSGGGSAEASKWARILPVRFGAVVENLKGDYRAMLETCGAKGDFGDSPCGSFDVSAAYGDVHDFPMADRVVKDAPLLKFNGNADVDLLCTRAQNALEAGRWQEALAWSKKAEDAVVKDPTQLFDLVIFARPYEAEAFAHSGDLARAKSVIATTPLDCDACVRARGRIETIAHNWGAAAYWFGMVSARSPDIPFADTDWGAMLLAKGDLAGAIAKLESANQKGPHFADPLEMWGEALVRENRSDLALAKFEEADKYAPNWGRLHLKWGEALLWSGKADEAKKQFAIAASLDLTSADRSELARVKSTHV